MNKATGNPTATVKATIIPIIDTTETFPIVMSSIYDVIQVSFKIWPYLCLKTTPSTLWKVNRKFKISSKFFSFAYFTILTAITPQIIILVVIK